jgi:hypothetical protein
MAQVVSEAAVLVDLLAAEAAWLIEPASPLSKTTQKRKPGARVPLSSQHRAIFLHAAMNRPDWNRVSAAGPDRDPENLCQPSSNLFQGRAISTSPL